LPDLVVGKSFGAGPLGLFSLAHEIANLPSTDLTAPINRAAYPGYAKAAGERNALRMQYLRVQGIVALLTTPAAAGLFAIAPLLVPLLLGDKWREAIPLLQILIPAGVLASWRTNAGYVFIAMGRPASSMLISAIRLALLLPALMAGTMLLGLPGAAWGLLLAALAMLPVTHGMVERLLGVGWRDYGRVLWRPILASAGMAVVVYHYIGLWGPDLSTGLTLLSCVSAVVLGALTYVALVALLWALSGFPESAEAGARGLIASGMKRRPRSRMSD
jgi:lipopolysaccharide exporter